MKSQRIFGSIAALGLVVSGITSGMMIGASKVIADDDRPAWSQRCDRDWDNEYCNPKIQPNRNGQWSDQEQWQNQDQGPWNGPWETVPDQIQGQGQNPWNKDQGQWQNPNRFFRNRLSEGTTFSAYPERRQRIVLRRSERYPLTLVVNKDVGQSSRYRNGRAVLPRGSRIEGELVPTRNGYRFESREVRLPNGRSEQIWATSNTIRFNNSFDRYERNTDGASSGAQIILNAILGRSNSSGSVYSGDIFERYPNARRDLVVIYPDQTLELRLTREFVRDQRNF